MRAKKTTNPILRFVQGITSTCIYVLNLAFILSIGAHVVAPSQFLFIAPFGLLFVPLVILHILIFILFLKRRKFWSFIALILLLIAARFIPRTINYHASDKKSGLTILSWNVKNFDLYNWTKNKYTPQRMMDLIDTMDADVLCFQEFFSNDYEHNNIESIERLGYPYHYFYTAFTENKRDKWGLAIFSKYPIRNSRLINLFPEINKMNNCIESNIVVNGTHYTIRNAHFKSIHLDYYDYNYIQNVKTEWRLFRPIETYHLLKKILMAYKKREFQIHQYLKNQDEDTTKTILCCDLNDIPNSYAYNQLAQRNKDAFVEKGRGFSNTTAVLFSIYRIDYIFASPDVRINSYNRIRTKLSDHHIIYASME